MRILIVDDEPQITRVLRMSSRSANLACSVSRA